MTLKMKIVLLLPAATDFKMTYFNNQLDAEDLRHIKM